MELRTLLVVFLRTNTFGYTVIINWKKMGIKRGFLKVEIFIRTERSFKRKNYILTTIIRATQGK